MKLIVGLSSVTQRFGFSKPARIYVAHGDQDLAIGQHPIKSVVWILEERIFLPAFLPEGMESSNSSTYIGR